MATGEGRHLWQVPYRERLRQERLVKSRFVAFRSGSAGEVRPVKSGTGGSWLREARYGEVWQASLVGARHGKAGQGKARQGLVGRGRAGKVSRVKSGSVPVWQDRPGMLRSGGACLGTAGQAR